MAKKTRIARARPADIEGEPEPPPEPVTPDSHLVHYRARRAVRMAIARTPHPAARHTMFRFI